MNYFVLLQKSCKLPCDWTHLNGSVCGQVQSEINYSKSCIYAYFKPVHYDNNAAAMPPWLHADFLRSLHIAHMLQQQQIYLRPAGSVSAGSRWTIFRIYAQENVLMVMVDAVDDRLEFQANKILSAWSQQGHDVDYSLSIGAEVV